MGFKKSGFTKLGFNPIGFRSATHDSIPFLSDALHYSNSVTDTTRPDRTGTFDRTSVMSKKWTGHVSGTYIRFADFVSTALTYYDLVLGTEVVTATDINGDFTLPLNAISYIDIAGYRWIPEEIIDAQDNDQTTFYDTTGTYQAQAFLTWYTDEQNAWVANSVQGEAYSDSYGVTAAQALGKNLVKNGDTELDVNNWVENSGGSIEVDGGRFKVSTVGSVKAVFQNVKVEPNIDYYISAITEDGTVTGEAVIIYEAGTGTAIQVGNGTFNSGERDEIDVGLYLNAVGYAYFSEIQLELGSTATAYEAWEGYYKDSAHTIPYSDGQPLHALDNGDGTFSQLYCKAWLDTGAQAPLDSVGRIKHQVGYGVAVENVVINGDFSDGTTGWTESSTTLSVANQIASFTATAQFGGIRQAIDLTTNDKIFLAAYINADSNQVRLFTDSVENEVYHSGSGSYEWVYAKVTANTTGSSLVRIEDFRSSGWTQVDIDGTKGLFVINMTTLGIESFTEAQMLALVQAGYFDDYKFFPESTNSGPNSFRLQQDYPLVQSADLTDTLVDDHTLDEPTNAVVSVATLNYNTGDQIFAKVDSGVLSKLLIYDRVMTSEEQATILLFLGIGETAIDSNGELTVDSNVDFAVAPKSEYYTE